MVQRWRRDIWDLVTIAALTAAGFFLALPSGAQPVPDDSLGAERSVIRREDNVRGRPADVIAGGARRGANLFHSFQDFNIDDLQRVYFANPAGVENILSRVTGINRSNILGQLGVLGNANLFLINPNGIFFGPNASLDIRGSFVASTANRVRFGDGIEFSAVDPAASALLTVSAPIGLQYGSNPGALQVERATLRVPSGQTLALVGGDVTVNGGRLQALEGYLELAGAAADGNIDLIADSSSLRLNFPISTPRANVSIAGGAQLNVRRGRNGSIAIYARNVDITGSTLLAGIAPELGTIDLSAGNIEINATEAINLLDESRIINQVATGARGNGGNINLTTESFLINNGARLSTSIFGEGNAGDVRIDARGTVRFDRGLVFSQVGEQANGQGGDILVRAHSVAIANEAQLSTSIFREGKAGNVEIHARDSIRFDNSNIFSSVEQSGRGDGGNVNITTRSLSLSNGAQLSASTRGQGEAGNVIIHAQDAVRFDRSSVFSTVGERGEGNGGSIRITTGSLLLTSGSRLSTNTFGEGDAGDVIINARDTVRFGGAGSNRFPNLAQSSVEGTGEGNGGNIYVNTGRLTLEGGSYLESAVRGTGSNNTAGTISINARGAVLLDGVNSSATGFNSSGVFSDSNRGNSGDIHITAASLSIANGAKISSSNRGPGDAGDVNLMISGVTSLDGLFRGGGFVSPDNDGSPASSIFSIDRGTGNAGAINITTGSLSVTNGAALGVSLFGTGNAGRVVINARSTVSFDGTGVLNGGSDRVLPSGAFSTVRPGAMGDGGSITINSRSLRVTRGAQLSASTSGEGDAGNIVIHARDTVRFDRSSAFSTVGENGRGNAGNIRIRTGSLSLLNASQLQTRTQGQGNSGNVRIDASDTVLFDGGTSRVVASGILNTVGSNAEGNGGEVTIRAPRLILRSNAAINSDAGSTRGGAGQGQAGDVNLYISERLSIIGGEPAPTGESARITLALTPGGIGSGGDLHIEAGTLELRDGGLIKVSTQGQGDAGNVSITAETVDISGSVPSRGLPSGIFTSSVTAGNAGDIDIDTQSFRIAEGAALSARSQGNGRGGNIRVTADRSFEAINGGQLITTAFGQGGAGNITVNASGQMTIAGIDSNYDARLSRFPNPIDPYVANDIDNGPYSGLYANTEPNSIGQGGNIRMSAGQLTIRDRAQVTATSNGAGNAGNIGLSAGQLTIRDRAQVTTSSNRSGSAGDVRLSAPAILLDNQAAIESNTTSNQGNVTLQTDILTLRRNSSITTNADGAGTGGNINIDADFILSPLNQNNDIIANADQGSGGQITLTAQSIFGFDVRTREDLERLRSTTNSDELNPGDLDTNDITAFSQSNPAIDTGTVTVRTPDLDPTQGLAALPTDLSDPSQLIAATCPADEGSSFAITGRGGLPEDPRQPLMGQVIWQDERGAGDDEEIGQANLPEAIVEAQGWIVDRSGSVVLVAPQSQIQQAAALRYPACALSNSSP